MLNKLTLLTFIVCLATILPTQALALSEEASTEFKVIMHLSLEELGQRATSLLEEKHPNENWSKHDFPRYVFNDLETEAAYKVATIRSNLLGKVNVSDDNIVIPCYCTCDNFGHDNLLYCFYKNGDPKEGYDNHGSQCAICIRQALLAFLWDDLGANHQEIMAGMKEKFAEVIEKYHNH